MKAKDEKVKDKKAKKPRKCNWDRILYSFIFAVSLLVLCYSGLLQHSSRSFLGEEPLSLQAYWKTESEEGEITGDYSTDSGNNITEGIRICHIIPATNDSMEYDTLAVYCHYQRIRVFLDEELVADSQDRYSSVRNYDSTDGVYWYVVSIPEKKTLSRLSLEITSPYTRNRKLEGEVLIGNKWSVMSKIVADNINMLVEACFLVLIGLFCVFYYIGKVRRTAQTSELLYLGCTLAWAGMWIVSQSGLMQLITDNSLLISCMGFAPVPTGVMSAQMYLRSVVQGRYRIWNNILLFLIAIVWVIMILLQMASVCDFSISISVFHVVIVIFAVSFEFELYDISFKRGIKRLRFMFFLLTILTSFMIAQIYIFYMESRIEYTWFSQVAMLLMIILIILFEFRQVQNDRDRAMRSDYYKEMSRIDSMTGLYNVRALQDYISSVINGQEKEIHFKGLDMVSFVMDLDRLKHINDTYGHKTGDIAICSTADCIIKTFGRDSMCARTGGDEFTCVALLSDSSQTDEMKKNFIAYVREKALKFEFPFSVSIGCAVFDPDKDSNVLDTIRRADKAMYKMKKERGVQRKN